MTLTKQQHKYLKGLGHSLKPVVMIGQNGLTEAVIAETNVALAAHELIKIQVGGIDKAQRKDRAEKICEQTGSLHVTTIGKQAIFYKAANTPRITLP